MNTEHLKKHNAKVFGKAKYIKAQQKPSDFSFYDPAPLFRKDFVVDDSEIVKAEIYVQSPGFACFYINGDPITKDILISPISDYTKILWYNVYDVTHLLHKGKNVIGAIAGNGFFNESFDTPWHYNNSPWRDAPQILLCLKINGSDVVFSDNTWRVSQECSHIIFNHLRSGEHVDMRKYDPSWMLASYDDSSWQNAIERDTPLTGKLQNCVCQPIREVERMSPVSIQKTDRGYLVDFGVTVSGYADVTLQAERDTEVLFWYTEDVDESLQPKYNNMNTDKFQFAAPFHLNKLIASGEVDHFKPCFTYHGFRYVLIEGLSYVSELIDIQACFVHQDVARLSDFQSGNEVINYIYHAGIRSTYSNLFWSLTDCPTREKLGWANDAQASIEQTLINFDILPLYEKWFEDLKVSMREDGALPGTIPSPGYGYLLGPICDGLLFELPYRAYLYTGDAHMLTDSLEYLERYTEYLDCMLKGNVEFKLGDWLGYVNSPLIPKRFVADFYLIKALTVTSLSCRLSGKDFKTWERRLQEARREIEDRYLDATGCCVINEQSAIAMLLAIGLYRDKRVLAEQLVSVVLRDKVKLTCGMVGVQYLYDALSDSGRADLAYRLITESEPGYRTWYQNGATTLWENWDGKDNGSHNHHMYSGVIAWFFKSLLGIALREETPGFEEISLRPCFIKSLGFVNGEMDTVRGRIEASWVKQEKGYLYTVTIPKGVRASFHGKMLSAGKNEFFVKE